MGGDPHANHPDNGEGNPGEDNAVALRRKPLLAARLRTEELLEVYNREGLCMQRRLHGLLTEGGSEVKVSVAAKNRVFTLACEFLDAACVSFEAACRQASSRALSEAGPNGSQP